MEKMVDELNAGKPQCPVGLNTLVLPRKSTLPPPDQTPYVYLKCGHVQGHHHWGKEGGEDRTCPICLKVGPFPNCLWVSSQHFGWIENDLRTLSIRAAIWLQRKQSSN